MADSVDIPDDLLRLMDVKAKSRGLTRDRLIVEVLRRSFSAASVGASPPVGGGAAHMAQTRRKAESQGAEAQRAVEDLALALRRRHRSELTTD